MSNHESDAPRYAGVHVDHPRIVIAIRNLAKQGVDKATAQRLIGMPNEIIDREYQNAKKDKSG